MQKVISYKLNVIGNWILAVGILLCAIPYFSFSQKFTASVNKNKVAVGEAFQVSFSLNTNGGNFTPPSFNDFDIYSGPNQSSSMQYINGNMSQSITLSYVIAAKREGKLTIGSAYINVDGKRYESNPISIEAVKSSNGNSSAQNHSQKSSGQTTGEDLFARAFVSKNKVYQGEQITLTYKIYTKLNIVNIQDEGLPDLNGFWYQRLGQTTYNVEQENIDGVVYRVIEVAKMFVFAQHSGQIEIGPINTKCVIRQRSSRSPQSIFDQFFGGGYEDVIAMAKSKPIKIDVLPLPENNKPQNFSGAVGNFSFKAAIPKENVKTNDAINLNISISGRGNLKFIDPVKINFPDNFEVYDPKINDNIGVNASGVNGSKSFEYLVIPRKEGTYKLEPISFSYFDPEKKTYVVLPSPDFNLTVEKGKEEENQGNSTVISSSSKEEVKQLNNDIRYINTNPADFYQKEEHFFGSLAFYMALTLNIVAFILFVLLRKKYVSYNNNTVLLRNRKANKIAKKRLQKAENYMKKKQKEDFYDELFRALYGYLSDKLNIPVSDLSKEKINTMLKNKGIKNEVSEQLIKTLDSCEYARYAPSSVSDDLTAMYIGTSELISQMEELL